MTINTSKRRRELERDDAHEEEPEFKALDEIDRLRGLVKRAERDHSGECPWCRSDMTHEPTCPAFTPSGAVK